ncbi:MAG: OmpA family protein [Ignavibacteria bacterium]|nr:OmpA family protein [Ignavibacteria bacterium]
MILFFVSFCESYSQVSTSNYDHAFSDAFVFGLDGGLTSATTDYKKSKIGFAFGGYGEYFFPASSSHIFGFRLTIGIQNVSGEDSRTQISSKDGPRQIPPTFMTNIQQVGFGVSYNFSIQEIAFPFLLISFSNSWIDPKDDNGNAASGNVAGLYTKNTKGYNIQLGVKFLVSDNVSINLTGGTHHPLSDYLDDVAASTADDSYYSALLGFSYSPFVDTDIDEDGIVNRFDACPENAEDYDGFEDDDGCPEDDNDLDGVKDELDRCPDEPEDYDGFQDLDGCPDMDNDGDGILDVYDKCKNTKEDFDGFEDKDGCPDTDNDGDGIVDSLDQCPNEPETFNGINDLDGCPDESKGTPERFYLGADEIFHENSARIKIEGKEYLDEIIPLFKQSQNKSWRIEGHMDSQGSERFLRTISLERAKAVLEYLVLFGGFNRENFQVYGMGDKFPISNNTTEEGRKRNRRIEIKLN